MDLLRTLGVNETFWYQLAILVIVFVYLSKLVVGPYLAAIEKRREMTLGSEAKADSVRSMASDLEKTYENRARDINRKISAVFDEVRTATRKEQDAKFQSAKADIEEFLKRERSKLASQEKSVREQLSRLPEELGDVVAEKMVSPGMK